MFVSPRRLVLLLAVAGTAACAREPQTFRDLLKQTAAAPDAAAKTALVEQFIGDRPNPIIEQNSRLVFFVKDDTTGRVPRLVGDFNAWSTGAAIPLVPLNPGAPRAYDQQAGTPIRIDGTPWSYVETSGYSNARLEYVFLYDKESVPDPRNPRRVRTFVGERSEIRMPAFVAHPELDGELPAARGSVTEEAFPSRQLQGPRRVWTYLPAGYDANQDLYPVAYILDGGSYAGWMEAPAVLDRLMASKRVPPFIAVFVEPGSRQEEYSRNPAWRAFVTTELVPAIDRRFRTFPAPEQRLVLGSSLAAYGAVDLAVAHPDVFGLCAAMAPPPQTTTLITNQVEGQRAIHGVRFYILGAQYDTDVNGARMLRTVLDRAAADARYEEVPEGHAAETFRGYLGNALGVLLPGPPA